MSLFDWLMPKKKPATAPESSGLSRMESTKPAAHLNDKAGASGQPANRKSERIARRELLYAVVREAMMRAGVLSSSYKFKVLSLDNRGTQFLVMIDLARAGAFDDGGSQAEIEALIAQTAKARYQIVVTAVYWRTNEHVATGVATAAAAKGRDARSVPPTALEGDSDLPVSMPAALESAPAPLESTDAPLSRGGGRFDPIQTDEVEAFRKALAQGVSGHQAVAAASQATAQAVVRGFDGSLKHGPQSYTLLTGFEDTELTEDSRPTPALSATQYGDLR